MNHPALKDEVSINKMLKLTNPRLRRLNIVVNSFDSCIPDATEEFPRTPEMSMLKVISKPRMFFEKLKGAVPFKKLESFANTHSRRKFNEKVDMIYSNVQLINFTLLPTSNFPNKELTIHPKSIKLKGVLCIFNFPHKVESILSKAMFSGFQIHFSSPEHSSNYIREFISGGLESRPSDSNHLEILNLEGGNSSLGLKAEVPLPQM